MIGNCLRTNQQHRSREQSKTEEPHGDQFEARRHMGGTRRALYFFGRSTATQRSTDFPGASFSARDALLRRDSTTSMPIACKRGKRELVLVIKIAGDDQQAVLVEPGAALIEDLFPSLLPVPEVLVAEKNEIEVIAEFLVLMQLRGVLNQKLRGQLRVRLPRLPDFANANVRADQAHIAPCVTSLPSETSVSASSHRPQARLRIWRSETAAGRCGATVC